MAVKGYPMISEAFESLNATELNPSLGEKIQARHRAVRSPFRIAEQEPIRNSSVRSRGEPAFDRDVHMTLAGDNGRQPIARAKGRRRSVAAWSAPALVPTHVSLTGCCRGSCPAGRNLVGRVLLSANPTTRACTRYRDRSTCRLLMTENTKGTSLARTLITCLSI